jgi:hypothetical protein
MTTRLSLSGLALATVLCGCSSDTTSTGTNTVLTDTLGNVYSMSCSSVCALTPIDTSLKPQSCANESNATDTFLLVWGTQILKVQALALPSYGTIAVSDAEPARPIACATDADCAPDLLSNAYTCQNRLCQYTPAGSSMKTSDVITLCQADIPWPTTCPYVTNPQFASRMVEVAAACGAKTTCSTVPADCMQATATVPPAPTIDAGVGAAIDSGAGASIDAGI